MATEEDNKNKEIPLSNSSFWKKPTGEKELTMQLTIEQLVDGCSDMSSVCDRCKECQGTVFQYGFLQETLCVPCATSIFKEHECSKGPHCAVCLELKDLVHMKTF